MRSSNARGWRSRCPGHCCSSREADGGWVVWGICARVAVSVTGHWLVGHIAHREGSQSWIVEGAAAQGYNVRLAGFISMGESWHNNHHAYPGSAKQKRDALMSARYA